MNLPPASHPTWSEIVTGKKKVVFELLAARMLLTRLRMNLARDKSPEAVAQCATQLREIFLQNGALPGAKRDLEKLGF
jgi:hypothetical protein